MADTLSMDQDFQADKMHFKSFLESEDGPGEYPEKVRLMMESKQRRLIIDINDLRQENPVLTGRLLQRPSHTIAACEEALKEVVLSFDPNYDSAPTGPDQPLRVGFEGSFGHQHVSPRGLRAKFIPSMVCLEGIVTKCSLVRPKVVRSVHYCRATRKYMQREYRDATSTDGPPTGSTYPTRDDDGNILETEFGLSTYKDYQTLTIQEMPERAPLGQLPRAVEILLEHDLVDRCKPGDRVKVVGTYRALAGSASAASGRSFFRTVVIANNLQPLGDESSGLNITTDDIANARKLSKRDDIVDLLGKSLAPSIYGHDYIKKALLLLLLGGQEKNLDNGTHLRGDINILMVGDPSTAKSQLLRFVLAIAPLAVNTTGRGSSGVGLTAAVTRDQETGERRLEAGAMVLADRGVVCIDEFDKMSEADRVAIHEVMEQQTVTIAKAGIHASLNARCSVVAAANPVQGQYDKRRKPQENIGLPDSLLSRFDLLFIVLDKLESNVDRAIAEHVLRMHRYQKPGQEGIPLALDRESLGCGFALSGAERRNENATSEVWQKYNPLLHGSLRQRGGHRGIQPKDDLLSVEFLRKYIFFAKSRFQPVLTDEAREAISESYADLREKQSTKTLPVTARSLETIIRISTAHAKARLSRKVELRDTQAAIELMNFALYNDADPDKMRSSENPADDEEELEADEASDEEREFEAMDSENQSPNRRKRNTNGESDSGEEHTPKKKRESMSRKRKAAIPGEMTAERRSAFKSKLVAARVALHNREAISKEDALPLMNQDISEPFSVEEFDLLARELEKENKIMFYHDEVHFL